MRIKLSVSLTYLLLCISCNTVTNTELCSNLRISENKRILVTESGEPFFWLGDTGYPIVYAGMRQLNSSGYMHNRVRMITSGFLCKHLLIDWRWGEAYFARKLLDYELSSNNGNWQWASGTGCNAAPYFRIFNPETQQKKFDPKEEYIKRWVNNFAKTDYPEKIVDHDYARQRALTVYKSGIKRNLKNI